MSGRTTTDRCGLLSQFLEVRDEKKSAIFCYEASAHGHTHCQMILWLERPKDWRLSEVQVEVLDGFNFSKGRGDGLTRYWRLCGMSIGLV